MDALDALAGWLAKATKVEVQPHPDDVIDVHPKVLASMKRRLKQKTPKGPRVPKKDIMDDSVHYGVKKAEPLTKLGIWLAKAELKGVHIPSGKTSGNSAAGQATRSHASAGPATGRKPRDKAVAVGEHKRVLGEMRGMKKPNLPKSHDSHDDDQEDCLKALGAWLAKAGKPVKKKKLKKDGEAQTDDDYKVADAVPMA